MTGKIPLSFSYDLERPLGNIVNKVTPVNLVARAKGEIT